MEGTASYFHTSVDRSNYRGYLAFGKKRKSAIKSSGLAGLETFNGVNAFKDAYPVSAYAVSLLVKSSGERAIGEYYKKIGQGKNWKKAFTESFNISPEDFYQSF